MPKSRSSAIINYSSQISNPIFLKSSAPDWLTMNVGQTLKKVNCHLVLYLKSPTRSVKSVESSLNSSSWTGLIILFYLHND